LEGYKSEQQTQEKYRKQILRKVEEKGVVKKRNKNVGVTAWRMGGKRGKPGRMGVATEGKVGR